MSATSDQPQLWIDETEKKEDILGELTIQDSQEITIVEEMPIEKQKELIEAEAPDDYKDALTSLVEVSQMTNILEAVDTEKSQYTRRRMLDLLSKNFIRKRLSTNEKLESLKLDLLNRVWDNIEQIDLTTSFEMLSRIHEITAMEAAKPIGGYTDPSMAGVPGGLGGATPAVNLTINNATGADSQITTNSMSIGAKPPVEDLKTVSKLSETVKAWGNVPKKVQPIVDVEVTGDNNQ